MQYRDYGKLGYKVSAFGMGCMRVPHDKDEHGNKVIRREEAIEMIRYAADHGVTYFDSALMYFGGDCDALLGEALAGGRREKVKVVSKIPPRMVKDEEDFNKTLDGMLEKLQTDHLDVLLAHDMNRTAWKLFQDKNMYSWMEKAKQAGKINAIAFSFHDDVELFKEMVDAYPWAMAQIQMNILDVDYQATVEGMKYAASKGLAIVIMEPLRGGGLANAPDAVQKIYDAYPEKRTPVEWALRFMYNFPEVSCILSGVSTMEQLKDNLRIFEDAQPDVLSQEDLNMIAEVRKTYQSLIKVPCTGCGYCIPCPKGVDIPRIFSLYNNGNMYNDFSTVVKDSYSHVLGDNASPLECIKCGACEKKCPQHIHIIDTLQQAHETITNA